MNRTFDVEAINKILNKPEVFKWIKQPGIERIDVSALILDPCNVALMVNGGCIIFAQQEPGIYEVHTNFLADARGSNAIRESRKAYRWMFTHTDCMILQTRVPAFNKQAEMFCKIVGAVKDFGRKAVWPTDDGPVDLSYWTLKYEDWLRKTPSLMESGRKFHERLDSELARYGAKQENHPDEDCHDLYVGVCAEIVYGGQPEKAVTLYNRWARFSGYGLISLLSTNPIIINIGTAALLIEDQTFTVIRCQSQH